MNNLSITTRRRIMYRVYLSFVLSLVEHRYFWQGALFGASLALFGRLVHVASVTHNLLATPLGELPGYVTAVVAHALASGEVLTVMVTALMLLVGVSFVKAFARVAVIPNLTRPA